MILSQAIIVVTGAARGIGCEIARTLLSKGARLALLDINQAALDEAVKGMVGDVRGYTCDVSNEQQVVDTFDRIAADFGGVHGLINNAGLIRDSQLIKVKDGKVVSKMSAEDYSLVVDVHMKGAFLCAREAASHMIETGAGDRCIINISSIARTGNFGQSNYSAAKAGMVAQGYVWAKELGRYGIRTMSIAPGTIATDMLRAMPSERLQAMADQVPLRRIGEVSHIAQVIMQILENDYLNGSVIDVDGGLRL